MVALATPLRLSHPRPKGAVEKLTLQNSDIDFQFVLRQGRIESRRLTNKQANETVDLPDADFALEFDNHAVVDPSDFKAEIAQKGAESIAIIYCGVSEATAGVQVRVEYFLRRAKCYLRKQISVRQAQGGITRRLMRADLDSWRGVKRDWKSTTSDSMPYGSHPIACESLWAGLEFPAAFNSCSKEGFVLRCRPGGKTLLSEWLPLHSTVFGIAEPGKVKQAFFRYLADIRLTAPRLVACYNTWYSLPDIYSERECLALVRDLVKSFYERQEVFFDFVTLDMGWSEQMKGSKGQGLRALP